MNKTKTDRTDVPVENAVDPKVISFRTQFDQRSPLDEIVREGPRRMLQSAIDDEVEAFIGMQSEPKPLRHSSLGLRPCHSCLTPFCTRAAFRMSGSSALVIMVARLKQ